MISSVELFFDDEENVQDIASIRRNLRDKSNPLELSSALFKAYFPLPKDAVVYVVETLKDDFKVSCRSTTIPPLLIVCAALRFLEDGSFQKPHGNDFNNLHGSIYIVESIEGSCPLDRGQIVPKLDRFEDDRGGKKAK
ncbi:uncharacterized protein [Musca autumnalis]|uniref:uncharacterized protein n=1 Tax=Musca autumnalis TaxID=221902 RepID=UPI003CF3909A